MKNDFWLQNFRQHWSVDWSLRNFGWAVLCQPRVTDAHYDDWWDDQQGFLGLHCRRIACEPFRNSETLVHVSYGFTAQHSCALAEALSLGALVEQAVWKLSFLSKFFVSPYIFHKNPENTEVRVISLCTGAAGAEIFLPELQGLLKPMALQVRRLKGM